MTSDHYVPINNPDPVLRAEIRDAIKELNEFISVTNEPIEGNVCYWDGTTADRYRVEPPTNDPDHVAKRVNLAILASRHRSMLEIGLNGGHSALISLMSNSRLNFFSIDIMLHAYTARAVEFLKPRFHRRFHFWPGDSRDVLPKLAVTMPTLHFDLIHIDGGHGPDLVFSDISNSIRMATDPATMVFDDVNAVHLNAILEEYIRLGHLWPIEPQAGLVPTPLHDIVAVRRSGRVARPIP